MEIGIGDKARKIGGEDVMYRHERTFFNRTALVYDVWDTMKEEELRARVREITDWQKFYVGEFLKVDAIAVRKGFQDCFSSFFFTMSATGASALFKTGLPTIAVWSPSPYRI